MEIKGAHHFQTLIIQLFAHPSFTASGQPDEAQQEMIEIDEFEQLLVKLIEEWNRGTGGILDNAPSVRALVWRKDG